jgi:hypothetical protein
MRKTFFLLLLIMFIPTFLMAQVAVEDIGIYTCYYGKDSQKTIYELSYKHGGERSGTDGEFGGTVSPNYSYVEEKTKKGVLKYWKLGFTGRCRRETGFTMNKGGKILIRLFDNSVITLITNHVGIEESYERGTWFFPSAKLSTENYNKIMQHGIKKLRFETYPKVFDVEYNVDEIGVFLKKATSILKEKINNKTDRMTKGF